MNTKLFYSFTDDDLWTRYISVVLKGELRWGEFRKLLEKKQWFLPYQVGLPDISSNMPTKTDHNWHHLNHNGVELTDDDPEIDLSADTFLQRLRKINKHWRDDVVIPVKYIKA
jgi:hypothetical protein